MLDVKHPEDWYSISPRQVAKVGGKPILYLYIITDYIGDQCPYFNRLMTIKEKDTRGL
jgi:hypothetical protein